MPAYPVEEALRCFTSKAAALETEAAIARQLKGNASNRAYCRIGSEPSFAVMVMPAGAKGTEEQTRGELPKELPFVNERVPEQAELRELLARYVPELA